MQNSTIFAENITLAQNNGSLILYNTMIMLSSIQCNNVLIYDNSLSNTLFYDQEMNHIMIQALDMLMFLAILTYILIIS